MSFAPLFDAPAIVQVHILSAIVALGLGPLALLRRRRDLWHRRAGYGYVVAMLVLAISGLFIPANVLRLVGPFGPIHLLSLYLIWGVVHGVLHARRGEIEAHRETMRAIWFQAFLLAGAFTLLPGRRMNRALFGEAEMLGVWVIGAMFVAWFIWRTNQRRRVVE
ncbi:MAG: DUF2306 domain-containing protein [Boseongicola sp.]|nr:DUF2306 domain-containing protein [Boseongicola sp.]NNJ66398.1 DUF2306 domain-containing protein [Boseongicola sp.]